MKSRIRASLILGCVVVSLSLLLAANMGFKITYSMLGPEAGTASGTNSLSLPYVPKDGLLIAEDLLDDINQQAGASIVTSIQRWDVLTDAPVSYSGSAGENFSLDAGAGYMVTLSTSVDYRIVGSHDPDLSILLLGADHPDTASGTNLISLPYHAVPATAEDLIADIGVGVVSSVARWDEATDSPESYSGTAGVNFPIVRGEAYFVTVSETVEYRPTHY